MRFPWQKKTRAPEPAQEAPAAPAVPPSLPAPELAELRIPVPPPDQHDISPGGQVARLVYLEAALQGLFDDRKHRDQRIAQQDQRIYQQDLHIKGLQTQNSNQQDQNNRLEASLTRQSIEIGELRGELKISERGRRAQGARLGRLEQAIPIYRRIVGLAILIIPAWEKYAAALQALLREHGIAYPEAPQFPELPALPELDPAPIPPEEEEEDG